jgi:hypothetical protein
MSSKHFHALLNYNNVLRSMAVRRFAISMPLTIHFHSEISISVDDEYVFWGKMTTESSAVYHPQSQRLVRICLLRNIRLRSRPCTRHPTYARSRKRNRRGKSAIVYKETAKVFLDDARSRLKRDACYDE